MQMAIAGSYTVSTQRFCVLQLHGDLKKNNTPTVKLLAEQETTKIPGCKGQPSAVGGLANGWPDVPTAPRGDGIPWHVGLQVSLRRYDQYSMVNPQELGHNSSIMLDILW